jgi:general secretion pathway protein M
MSHLPRRLSQALALVLLAALVVIPLLAIVLPLSGDYAATAARSAQARLALGRYGRVAARLPQQRAILAELERRRGRQDGFLVGANDTLVGAALQNRIKTAVEAAHGELRSTQILPPRDDSDFRQISVRVEMTAELPAVQAILYQLEGSSPTLFLDNVDLRAHPMDRRDGSDDDPPLDASFEVYGYVRAQ